MRPVCVKRAGRWKDPASACEGGRLLNGITKLQFRLIAQHDDIYEPGVLVQLVDISILFPPYRYLATFNSSHAR